MRTQLKPTTAVTEESNNPNTATSDISSLIDPAIVDLLIRPVFEDEQMALLDEQDAVRIATLLKQEQIDSTYNSEGLVIIPLSRVMQAETRLVIVKAGYILDDDNIVIGRSPFKSSEQKETSAQSLYSPTHAKATLDASNRAELLKQLNSTFADLKEDEPIQAQLLRPHKPTTAELAQLVSDAGLNSHALEAVACDPLESNGHYPVEISLKTPITLDEFYFKILKNLKRNNYTASISESRNVLMIVADPDLIATTKAKKMAQNNHANLSNELERELDALITNLTKGIDSCSFNRKRKKKKLTALLYLQDCIKQNTHHQSLEEIVQETLQLSRLANNGNDVILQGFFSFSHFGSNRTENLLTKICGGKENFKKIMKELEPQKQAAQTVKNHS